MSVSDSRFKTRKATYHHASMIGTPVPSQEKKTSSSKIKKATSPIEITTYQDNLKKFLA